MFALVMACAAPAQVSISALISEAQANEVRATARHASQVYAISGTVVGTGFRDTGVFEADAVGSSVRLQELREPYAALVTPDGAAFYCTFEGARAAATLEVGQFVSLQGRFGYFWRAPEGTRVVFRECRPLGERRGSPRRR
ncbi:MAG: hypothetical protein AAGH15_24675 [Myxococcota bacterium]